MHKKLYIFTDGGSRGNPGDAAIGILILDENKKPIKQFKQYIGKTTNNQAEYTALVTALEFASEFSKGEITCTSDSELLVKQLNGNYKDKDNNLKKLFDKVKDLGKKFTKINYNHVNRENPLIQKVDALVNEALDERSRL